MSEKWRVTTEPERRGPHQVTRDFEAELRRYTGAPFAVAVSSCTMALTLAVAWHIQAERAARVRTHGRAEAALMDDYRPAVEIPKRTYVSVPMAIMHAGGRPTFRDENWLGAYQLKPLPVWDSARYFTSGLYRGEMAESRPSLKMTRDCVGQMVCVSFHASKTLGIEQGGAILHDDPEADAWLRRARFDGRTEGVAPKDDNFTQLGFHCYLNPSTAAQGLMKLATLPKHNAPLPNDPYPDLSKFPLFTGG